MQKTNNKFMNLKVDMVFKLKLVKILDVIVAYDILKSHITCVCDVAKMNIFKTNRTQH